MTATDLFLCFFCGVLVGSACWLNGYYFGKASH